MARDAAETEGLEAAADGVERAPTMEGRDVGTGRRPARAAAGVCGLTAPVAGVRAERRLLAAVEVVGVRVEAAVDAADRSRVAGVMGDAVRLTLPAVTPERLDADERVPGRVDGVAVPDLTGERVTAGFVGDAALLAASELWAAVVRGVLLLGTPRDGRALALAMEEEGVGAVRPTVWLIDREELIQLSSDDFSFAIIGTCRKSFYSQRELPSSYAGSRFWRKLLLVGPQASAPQQQPASSSPAPGELRVALHLEASLRPSATGRNPRAHPQD